MLEVPPQMYVTTDAVTVSWSSQAGLRVLLIKRANPPYQDYWALPGGFVEEHEDLPDACARELEEETGVQAVTMVQIGAWGKPGRDPRGRNVSVAYLAVARAESEEARAGSDAAQVGWHRADDVPSLAFDHKDIVAAGVDRLRSLAADTHLVFALLPERFRLEELQGVLTDVRGELVAEGEAMAMAKRARVVKEAAAGGREVELYRCVTPDFLTLLRKA